VELKTQRGRLSRDRVMTDRYGHSYYVKGQFETVRELVAAGQEVWVWRPADWPDVLRILGVEDVSTQANVAQAAQSVPRLVR
jgi:hypothetical protein